MINNDIIYALEAEGYECFDYGQTIHVQAIDSRGNNVMPTEDMADDIYDIASMYDSVDVFIQRQTAIVVIEVGV